MTGGGTAPGWLPVVPPTRATWGARAQAGVPAERHTPAADFLGRTGLTAIRGMALGVAAGTTAASPLPVSRLAWCAPLALMMVGRAAVRARPGIRSVPPVADAAADLLLTCLAVVGTGGMASGFTFYAVVSVGLTALERPLVDALVIAGLGWGLVMAGVTADRRVPAAPVAAIWAAELVLGLVAGAYARRLLAEVDEARQRSLADLERLGRTNQLLTDLCRQAGEGALAADPVGGAQWVAAHLERVFAPDTLVVLGLPDGPDGPAEVLLAQGVALAATVPLAALPPSMAEALSADGGVLALVGGDQPAGPGVGSSSACGIYVPLRVADRVVGLLAMEAGDPDRWDASDLALVETVAVRAALDIDNARRFVSLCVTGLAEERSRLAGELHDRTGQSVAALGIQLDGILRAVDDPELKQDLKLVRQGVRAAMAELRNTLSDLRCEVSESVDLCEALRRIPSRYPDHPRVTVTTGGNERLPLVQERQIYLLAREAVATAAASGAGNVSVYWLQGQDGAVLEVLDDAPLPPAPGPRYPGSAGRHLTAVEIMRARCEALGGKFHLTHAKRGTVLRCSL